MDHDLRFSDSADGRDTRYAWMIDRAAATALMALTSMFALIRLPPTSDNDERPPGPAAAVPTEPAGLPILNERPDTKW
jgi:hypothetical protein